MAGTTALQRLNAELRAELSGMAKQRRLRELPQARVATTPRIELRGKELLDFTSWDYLNLGEQNSYRAIIPRSVSTQGFGSRSPRGCSGNSREHAEVERRLAEFMETESALIFSSRNQAVLSLITAFVGEGDLVVSHEMTQSPVADAVYLTGARHLSIPTLSPEQLDRALEREPTTGKRFLFIESVSILSGEAVAVEPLLTAAARHDLLIVVDESYALAAVGARGAGLLENSPLRPQIFAWIGDLTRGLGGVGAAVASSAAVTGFLIQRSRTFQHEIPFPLPLMELTAHALDLVQLNDLWRTRLALLAAHFAQGLAGVGLMLPRSPSLPIFCCGMRTMAEGATLQGELMQRGFLCEHIHPIALRSESSALRFILNVAHTEQQIDQVVAALGELLPRVRRGGQ